MKGSHREGASQLDTAAHLDREIKNGLKILWLKIGVVLENLFLGCAGCEPAEYVPHGDAQAADAGLAGALARLDGDAGLGGAAHAEMIARFGK